MKDWMILTLIYGLMNGACFLFEKEAMKKNHSIEVLTMSTTVAFLLIIWDVPNAIHINPCNLSLLFIKSLVVFIAWKLSFKALSKMSVSRYGVINMSRILFTTILGIVVLHEVLRLNQIVGMAIICIGLVLVNMLKRDGKKSANKYIGILLIGCLLQSIAGLLDKVISTNVEPNILQWWFLFFLVIINWAYINIRNVKINYKASFKNIWVYAYSILFVIGDRFLFMANSIDGSEISIISLLKQVSIIVTVLVGGKIFHEKHLKAKFLCSLLIILGIIIITLY